MSNFWNINNVFLFLSLTSIVFLAGCGVESAQSPAVVQEPVKSPQYQDLSALLKKGNAGDADAQFELGWRYSKGEGVSQDSAKAVEWYKKAAAQGEACAKFNLAIAYENGDGVLKDDAKAVALYKAAAARAVPRAQHQLGTKYFYGKGVPKDKVLAYAWFKLAAVSKVEKVKHAELHLSVTGYLLSKDELAEAQRLATGWEMGQSIVREGK